MFPRRPGCGSLDAASDRRFQERGDFRAPFPRTAADRCAWRHACRDAAVAHQSEFRNRRGVWAPRAHAKEIRVKSDLRLALMASALAAAALGGTAAASAQEKKPNILVIMGDD